MTSNLKKEERKVRKFDKMARKYIKILNLKYDPEECFYDDLAHFILTWEQKQYRCRLILEDIERYNVCQGNCKDCEFKKT